MDIKHIRKLIAKRLDDAIEILHDLRSDVGAFEESETWLADGLEVVLENISKLAAHADINDFSDLINDIDASLDEEEGEEHLLDDIDNDDHDDEDDTEGELDFGDESYGSDEED